MKQACSIKFQTKMKRFLFFALVVVQFLSACTSSKDDQKMCTEEFRMITLSILNPDLSYLQPTAYYMVNLVTGDTILNHLTYPYDVTNIGPIVIFSDNEMIYTSNSGKSFRLTCYSGDELVVDENYVIKHDDCHVILVSGKTEIQLTN